MKFITDPSKPIIYAKEMPSEIGAKLAIKHNLYVKGWTSKILYKSAIDIPFLYRTTLVFINEHPVGCAIYNKYSRVISVFVEAHHRRRGFGTSLVKAFDFDDSEKASIISGAGESVKNKIEGAFFTKQGIPYSGDIDFFTLEAIRFIKNVSIDIVKWMKSYYNDGIPLISDFIYDKIINEYKLTSSKYRYDPLNGLLDTVGFTPSDGNIVSLNTPMKSLKRAYNLEHISDWLNKVYKHSSEVRLVIEPKIDGLAMEITYDEGKLVSIHLKGTDKLGTDVTHKLDLFGNIFDEIVFKEKVVFRGEAHICKFLYKHLLDHGLIASTEGNHRSVVNGLLKSKNKDLSKLDGIISFTAWDSDNEYEAALKYSTGYRNNEHWLHRSINQVSVGCSYSSPSEAMNIIREVITQVDDKVLWSEFFIDGVVIKVVDKSVKEVMGETKKYPNWALAFKMGMEQKETKVLGIEISIGPTGRFTPIGLLETIVLNGSNVSRVSFSNFAKMIRLGIGVGSIITVERSGMTTPVVVSVSTIKEFVVPTHCPICNKELVTISSIHHCPECRDVSLTIF